MSADVLTNPNLIQAVVYSTAPFFANPFKLVLNHLVGGDYGQTYFHFRRDHMDGFNLLLHFFCLFYQLCGNYALLNHIDPSRSKFLSWGTTLGWLFVLLSSPAPLIVQAASVLAILVAQVALAPIYQRHWRTFAFLQGVVESLAVQVLVLKIPLAQSVLPFLGFFLARSIVWYVVNSALYARLRSLRWPISAVLFSAVVIVAWSDNSLEAKTAPLALCGWLVALLTGEPAWFFLGGGLAASVSQGVAHNIAGELGTLQVMQADKLDTAIYELSHVVYFPLISLQACFEHLHWL